MNFSFQFWCLLRLLHQQLERRLCEPEQHVHPEPELPLRFHKHLRYLIHGQQSQLRFEKKLNLNKYFNILATTNKTQLVIDKFFFI